MPEQSKPTDVAETLARPEVIARIRYLVKRAMLSGGVADPHATRLALSFAERLEQGAPEVTAINLVEAILGCRPDPDERAARIAGFREGYFCALTETGNTLVKEREVGTMADEAAAHYDECLPKLGTQFGTQSSTETTTAPESAAEVTSR